MKTDKICPLRLIAFNKYIGTIMTKSLDAGCVCIEECAWYIKYNDKRKSCCALVDIANVLTNIRSV